ncbi:MAG: hypothetical protein R2737_12210 [Candidatus Nanopelagicales bacterium]
MPASAVPPGPRSAPGATAVLAHGAGSTAEFVRRAFPRTALVAASVTRVVALDDRTGDVARVTAAVVAAAVRERAAGREVVLGGVSLGAHAAVLAADRLASSGAPPAGLLLALPAWSGAPDEVAAATAAAADDVAEHGVAGVLRRLRRDPVLAGDWVVAELARAWPGYGDRRLVACLRAAALSAGPADAVLRALPVPAGLVALADDPLHPERVARRWSTVLRTAAVEVVARDAPAADRAVLGRAAAQALQRARSGPGVGP